MARLDRTRTANQLRPFFSSQNLLNRADGSAQFDFGKLCMTSSLSFSFVFAWQLGNRAVFKLT